MGAALEPVGATARATDGPVGPAPVLTRRGFVGAAGAVLFAFAVPSVLRARPAAAATGATTTATTATTATTTMSAWIAIASDGTTTIQVGSTEMGQGVLTSLAQIVAEELEVDWPMVRSQHSPAGAAYGNPAYGGSQVTGGSYSVRGYYTPLRIAGATVRQMLLQAAANAWNVSVTTCVAAHGMVRHTPTGRTMTYGQLAPAAATLSPPANPPLNAPSSFTLIGTSVPRLDIPSKTTGQAVYANDVRLPGMLYAAIKHGPTLGCSVVSVGKPPTGVSAVNLGTAVATVAPTWYAAFAAGSRLSVTWRKPSNLALYDSATIAKAAANYMTAPPSVVTAETAGNAQAGIASAAKTINASYSVPYLVHGCLEPVTCTALVTSTACTIWACTQNQSAAVSAVANATGLAASAITVHTTLLGAGLGRKLETDFIDQSVRIAMAHPGTPVQLMWPRREDFANDFYRPMALTNVQAGIDNTGQVTGWWDRIVTPSILAQKGTLTGSLDDYAVEGAVAQPYTFANRLVEWVPHTTASIPLGFWRSVGHSFNAFAVESAMDELALLAGKDPLAFRLAALPSGSRHATVLKAAASLAGWGHPPAGRAQGMALHESFGTVVAMVAEVSQPSSGQIQVNRMSCAVDCGLAVHPDQVAAQIEGGVVHGLNAALFGTMTMTAGVVSPTNFDKFRVLRLKEMPQVDVQLVNTGAPLGGVGEPGSPPVAPAVANAWAALTGKRLRSLPMF